MSCPPPRRWAFPPAVAALVAGFAFLATIPSQAADPAATSDATIPLLIPRPKFVRSAPTTQAFRLDARTRLIVRNDATPTDRRGAVLLQAEVRSRFGLTLPIVDCRADGRRTFDFDDTIRSGRAWTARRCIGPLFRTLLRGGTTSRCRKGYARGRRQPGRVLIAGHDRAGTLWGAETVIQLLARDARRTTFVQPVAVHDWPTLGIRAVAPVSTGKDALPFQEKADRPRI